jgi:hypothetical protein
MCSYVTLKPTSVACVRHIGKELSTKYLTALKLCTTLRAVTERMKRVKHSQHNQTFYRLYYKHGSRNQYETMYFIVVNVSCGLG